MSDIDRECSGCGSSDWYESDKLQTKREDSGTEKRVFFCNGCGSEGRRFEDGASGYVTWSGALR